MLTHEVMYQALPIFTAPSDGALERDMGTNYPRSSGRLQDLCTCEFVDSVEE